MTLRSTMASHKANSSNDTDGPGSARPRQKSRERKAPGRTPGKRDYVLEDQVGFLLRVAMQRHTGIFMGAMVGGLTQTQFATIAKLRDVGTCSQNQLARLVALDAATINGVLDRLRKRGFITSQPDPSDGRQRVTALTAKGRQIADQAVKTAKQITIDTLSPLNATERKQLSRLLKKIS